MVRSAETERKKQAFRDALLHSIYMQRDGASHSGGEGETSPFYSWKKTKETADSDDYGALEMLARSINQPGTTQDAGVVLAVELESGLVKSCSPNTEAFLGVVVDKVLGSPAASLFSCEAGKFEAALGREGSIPSTVRLKLAQKNKLADVTFSRSEHGVMMDVEDAFDEGDPTFDLAAAKAIAASTSETVAAITSQDELRSWIVATIQTLSRFDRVKLYQFHPDQHGEVLEEALVSGCALESCRGLHYPATDIPQRARDLFLLNQIRFIKDTSQPPLQLAVSSETSPTAVPLTASCLRGVHPVHMEYLRNMKVTASLTFAVIIKGKLWGLVACHHGGGPMLVPRMIRNECWEITQKWTQRLSELLGAEREAQLVSLEATKQRILAMMSPEAAHLDVFSRKMDMFLEALKCDGCALVAQDVVFQSGAAPTDHVIRHVVTQASGELDKTGCVAIDSISDRLGVSTEDCAGSAGALMVKVSPKATLVWLRNEFVRQVQWGADDNQDGTPNLFGARESFNQWTQEVAGECSPWSPADCQDAASVGQGLAERIIAVSNTPEFVTDLAGGVLQWNEAMHQLASLPADLAVGKKLSDLVYLCDQADVQRRVSEACKMRSSGMSRLKLKIRTQKSPDPTVFVLVKSTNAQGVPTLHLRADSADGAASHAVPDEVPAEVGVVLRRWKGGEPYTIPDDFSVLDEVHTPFFIMDANPVARTYLWANQATCRALKLTKSEFYCLDLREDFVDARVLQLWYDRVQVGHQPVQGTHQFHNGSQTHSVLLDVEVAPVNVRAEDGTSRAVCFVSAKTHSESSPTDAPAKRSMEMMQGAKVLMMLFHDNGRLIASNVSAEVHYSTTMARSGLTLRGVLESCLWETADECADAYNQMLAHCRQQASTAFELVRVKRHVWADVVHLLQFCAARDPASGSFAIAVHETDVSGLHSVRQELSASKQQHERILAAVSHELRTPLHAILALSRSLLDDPELPPSAAGAMQLVNSSGRQLADLVDHILDAAALREGGLVVENKPVDLRAIVEHVLAVCGRLAAREVEMIMDVAGDLGGVTGDAKCLTQVLTNLVGNAVKFTSAGSVKVSAHMDTANSQVRILVADTGKGVPQDQLSAIWQPFNQVESRAGGTGLGLSIVERLVSAMGGVITVKSETDDSAEGGRGTSFQILLPSAQQARAERKQSGEMPALIDREPSSRFSLNAAQCGAGASAALDGLSQRLVAAEEKLRKRDDEVEQLRAELAKWESGRQVGPSVEQRHTFTRSLDGLYLSLSPLPEEARRAVERLGCEVAVLGPEEAADKVELEQQLPSFVLLDADGLGLSLPRAARWARELRDVPVLLVVADDSDAAVGAAVRLGCTGQVKVPLEMASLAKELRQQRDLRELWLCAGSLRTPLLASEAMAERTQALLEAKPEAQARVHDKVGVVCLRFEVESVVERTAHAEVQDFQLLTSRLHELVAATASENRALLTEAAGDRFVLVVSGTITGDGLDMALLAAHRLAVRLLEMVQDNQRVFFENGAKVAMRAGVDAGCVHEALVGCDLQRLAFFGPPLTQAAKVAAIAEDGCVGMTAQAYALLYPSQEAKISFADVFFFVLRDRSWVSRVVAGNLLGKVKPVRTHGVPDPHREMESHDLPDSHLLADEAQQYSSYVDFASNAFAMLEGTDLERRLLDRTGALLTRKDLSMTSVLLKAATNTAGQRLTSSANSETKATWSTAPSRLEGSRCDQVSGSGTDRAGGSVRAVTVLSVDDNPVNQVVVERALLPLGYAVVTCMDTPEAFDTLEKMDGRPDIILLDVMLPTESGVAALRRLRDRFSCTDLPVILVSGKSSKASIIEGLEAGGNDYIVKPFDTAELVARIKTQLGMSSKARMEVELARKTELIEKMLPTDMVHSLLAGETPVHHDFDSVSFMVAEIVGYQDLAQQLRTDELVELLTGLYSGFDDLCDDFGMFRVETEPFTYLVVSSKSVDDQQEHACRLVQLGLAMIRLSRSYINAVTGDLLDIRLGINSGPSSAGVISTKLPHYCFFGETVTVAKEILRNGFASTITLSPDAAAMIQEAFPCASLGVRIVAATTPMELFVVKDQLCPWEQAVTASSEWPNFIATTDSARVPASLETFALSNRSSGSAKHLVPQPCLSPLRVAQANTASTSSGSQPEVERSRKPAQGSGLSLSAATTSPQPDPLGEVLRRAGLKHMQESLVQHGADVEMLATCEDSDLNALGITAKGDHFRVRRIARAWMALYGAGS